MARSGVAGVSVDVEGQPGQPLVLLAHGAGGTMETPLLVGVQHALVQSGLAAGRFNFPYTETGRKAPDKAPVLMQTILDVVSEVCRRLKPSRLILGGKSMGGRMASMLVAENRIESVDGLALLGYPLHPMGKPEALRKDHLFNVRCPMLFMSGTNDKLARRDLLEKTVAELGPRARLVWVDGGDHSLQVRKTDPVPAVAAAIEAWYRTISD